MAAIRWPDWDCLAGPPVVLPPFDEAIWKPGLVEESSAGNTNSWDFGSNNEWFSRANATLVDESQSQSFDIYH